MFDLQRALRLEPDLLEPEAAHDHEHHECDEGCSHEHHHHPHAGHYDGKPSPVHDVTVGSISLRTGELDPGKFFPWIHALTQARGPSILRMKGILAFRDEPRRYAGRGCT